MTSHHRHHKTIRRMTLPEYEEGIRRVARRDGLTSRDVMGLMAACEEAIKSDVPFAKVGCAIMCQGVVVSVGHNSLKTDPTQRRWNRFRDFEHVTPSDPANMDSLHAEVAAIKGVPYPVARQTKWGQAKAYVFRVAPGLPLGHGIARPCQACWRALGDRGIRQVMYTTDRGFAKEPVVT